MNEDQQAVQPSADEQGQVSPTEQSNDEVIDQSPDQEATEQSQEDTQDETINNSSEQTPQPTRREKRISKLQKQKEGIDGLLTQLKGGVSQQLQGESQPLIQPGDYEAGLDPQELERRLEARDISTRDQVKREMVSFIDYRDSVKDVYQDVNDTLKAPELDPNSDQYDELLDEVVSEQFERANTVYDPMTGQKSFVPNVKLSELLAKQKAIIERQTTRATAQMQNRLTEQSSDNDLAPGSQSKLGEPSLQELRKNMRTNPGQVSDALRKKLGYSED